VFWGKLTGLRGLLFIGNKGKECIKDKKEFQIHLSHSQLLEMEKKGKKVRKLMTRKYSSGNCSLYGCLSPPSVPITKYTRLGDL
jgi:hypothetical protein